MPLHLIHCPLEEYSEFPLGFPVELINHIRCDDFGRRHRNFARPRIESIYLGDATFDEFAQIDAALGACGQMVSLSNRVFSISDRNHRVTDIIDGNYVEFDFRAAGEKCELPLTEPLYRLIKNKEMERAPRA